jgi:peptidoglycan/LPS O-acetylase OafA/YrhL
MTQPRRIRFVALDSWRGLCALLVAVYNARSSSSSFLTHASLFVDFFFVLSGFVITHAYMTKLETRLDMYSFVLRQTANRVKARDLWCDLH